MYLSVEMPKPSKWGSSFNVLLPLKDETTYYAENQELINSSNNKDIYEIWEAETEADEWFLGFFRHWKKDPSCYRDKYFFGVRKKSLLINSTLESYFMNKLYSTHFNLRF